MIPATLSTARKDERLRRSPAAKVILQFCCEYLDTLSHRPLKLDLVVIECHVSRMAAQRALDLLTTCAYLERGARPKGEARHYRLLPPPLLGVKRRAA